jgi:hypothetical protein
MPRIEAKGRLKQVCLLPGEMSIAIGEIIFFWSDFESKFDHFLEALLLVAKDAKEGWQFQKFPKRLRLFRDLINVCFPECPTLTSILQEMLGQATSAHKKRNALVHGRIIVAPFSAAEPGVVRVFIFGQQSSSGVLLKIKARDAPYIFALTDLQDLSSDLSILAASMEILSFSFISPESWPHLPSREIQSLRAFQANIRPIVASPETPSPQRQSPRG